VVEFGNAWVFLLLLLYFVCYKFCPIKKTAIYFPHFEFVQKIDKNNILKFLIFFFVVLALSNPYKKKYIIQKNLGDSIVLAIDSSGSMQYFDKFKIVKKVASDFISKRKNDKLGLVIFGTNAFIVSPLTKDLRFVRGALKRMYVGIAGERTAIFDALLQSVRILKDSKSKTKIIILLTDGIDNSSNINPKTTIKEIQKYHIKVYTIGVGNQVDRGLLEYIANHSGGKSYLAYTPNDIKSIYKEINKLEKTNMKYRIFYKQYYFYYPLGIALILLLLYVRRVKW